MDETQDPMPHPIIPKDLRPAANEREAFSIWFFVGILTLAYGTVLLATGIYEHFGHQPNTVLARLEPTFWWGLVLFLFGGFYTTKFWPRKG